MLHLLAAASFLLSLPKAHAYGGCNNPAYYPCPPQTNSGSSGFGVTLPPTLLSGGLGYPSAVQGVAGDPIQGSDDDGGGDSSDPGGSARRVMARGIAERQNTALCCRPAPVQCRIWTEYNVPFCYDPSDTRWFFADGSVYFADNGTYFGADGYDVDLVTGDYSYANGTTGNIYADQGEAPPSTSTLSLAAASTGGASAAPTAAGSVLSSAATDVASSQTSMPASSATPASSVASTAGTASMAGTASVASSTPSGTAAAKSGAGRVVLGGRLVAGLGALVLAVGCAL
ncbi:hypothetical protein MMC34_001623 [Xylographa carneopallida]|nr:hypothetical protein [Xylographa carneopallida]